MKTLKQIFQEYGYTDRSVDSALENDDREVTFTEYEVKTDKTLYDVFEQYKKEFDLGFLKLEIVDIKQRDGSDTLGLYSPSRKVIKLPSDKMRSFTLNTLFHEICHAIQDKEGRLSKKATESTVEDFINCEIEAVLFARHHTMKMCPSFQDRHLTVYALSYLKEWKTANGRT